WAPIYKPTPESLKSLAHVLQMNPPQQLKVSASFSDVWTWMSSRQIRHGPVDGVCGSSLMDVSSTPKKRCGPMILDSLPQDRLLYVSVGKPFTHAPQQPPARIARSLAGRQDSRRNSNLSFSSSSDRIANISRLSARRRRVAAFVSRFDGYSSRYLPRLQFNRQPSQGEIAEIGKPTTTKPSLVHPALLARDSSSASRIPVKQRLTIYLACEAPSNVGLPGRNSMGSNLVEVRTASHAVRTAAGPQALRSGPQN
ncbi:hypothetical protein THAOC_13406, partial [Thalassiosira oceanica]